METLITIIQQYAEWIYAICGFTALYNIYQTWQIRAARRQAVFTLERQKAVDDLYKILFTALVLLGVMGVTYFSGNVLARAIGLPADDQSISDNIPQIQGIPVGGLGIDGEESVGSNELTNEGGTADESQTSTAATGQESSGDTNAGATTDDDQAGTASSDQAGAAGAENTASEANQSGDAANSSADSSANSPDSPTVPSVVNVGAQPAPTQPVPTPTFTYAPPPPPPTITPTTAPLVAPPSCPDPRSTITSPGNGAIVTGSFSIVGTAAHEQMQFFKVEYVPGTNTNQEFIYLSGGNNPVNGGVLATVDSTIWYNGTWTIKVTVVDNTGNFPPPCTVSITVSN